MINFAETWNKILRIFKRKDPDWKVLVSMATLHALPYRRQVSVFNNCHNC